MCSSQNLDSNCVCGRTAPADDRAGNIVIAIDWTALWSNLKFKFYDDVSETRVMSFFDIHYQFGGKGKCFINEGESSLKSVK